MSEDQQQVNASEENDTNNVDDTDETLTNVTDLNEDTKKQSKAKSKSAVKDTKEEKRKKFFQEELKRLQRSLKEESDKIQVPPVQEYVPYCFNTLAPYYNTDTAVHVIVKTGDDGKLKDMAPEYATRQTAIGLVDPWVNHRMDKELASKVKVKDPTPFRVPPKKEKKVGDGSTMIPVFPTVNLDTPDIESRTLNYNDVPMLRKELKEKYSSQGKAKIEKDYERTKVDFYRMELHRLKDVHPVNRDNMKAAYFAYLQNTPGSKKAVKECVKEVTEEKVDNSETNEQQQQQPIEAAE